MGSVNHDSWRRLVLSFQSNGRRWTRNNYMKLDEEMGCGQFFFWEWEKLSFDFACEKVWHLFGFGLYLIEDGSSS